MLRCVFLRGVVWGVFGVVGVRGVPARFFAFSPAAFAAAFAALTTFAFRRLATSVFDGFFTFASAVLFASFAAAAATVTWRFVMALLFCGRFQRADFCSCHVVSMLRRWPRMINDLK